MPAHKHAALIKAWADGAVIEWRPGGAGYTWEETVKPSWNSICEYRVKPTAPNYGQIAKDAWYAAPADGKSLEFTRKWEAAAQAAIAAYKEAHANAC